MKLDDCKLENRRLSLLVNPASMAEAKRFLLHFKPGNYELRHGANRRSLDANAMLWRLCGLIGEAVGESKDDIYRKNIREAGVFPLIEVASDAVYDFCKAWSSHGIGWFAEVADNAGDDRKLVVAYHGSSTYDTKQMSRLIDSVLQDAAAVGVETMSERERTLLLDDWDRRQGGDTAAPQGGAL